MTWSRIDSLLATLPVPNSTFSIITRCVTWTGMAGTRRHDHRTPLDDLGRLPRGRERPPRQLVTQLAQGALAYARELELLAERQRERANIAVAARQLDDLAVNCLELGQRCQRGGHDRALGSSVLALRTWLHRAITICAVFRVRGAGGAPALGCPSHGLYFTPQKASGRRTP